LRFALIILLGSVLSAAAQTREWQAQLLPAEKKVYTDSVTGHTITALSTRPSREQIGPCRHNAVLCDGSMIVFTSDRDGLTAYYGCLTEGGELVKFLPDAVSNAYGAVVSRYRPLLYLLRKRSLFSWQITQTRTEQSTVVNVQEKKLGEIPEGYSLLEPMTESGDGRCLSLLLQDQVDEAAVAAFFIETGELRFLARGLAGASRLQFSPYDATSLLFLGRDDPSAVWLLDTSGQPARLLRALAGTQSFGHVQWRPHDRIALLTSDQHSAAALERISTRSGHADSAKVAIPVPFAAACLSPDGRWLAGQDRQGAVVVGDLVQGSWTRVAGGVAAAAADFIPCVTWDAMGRWILFNSATGKSSDVCLFAVAAILKK